jgi:type III pantothenate kinase
MFLAIDIGNTHTVFGVYDGKKLLHDWRVTSTLHRTEDEIGSLLLSSLQNAGIKPKQVKGIGLSSVVPNLTDIVLAMAEK